LMLDQCFPIDPFAGATVAEAERPQQTPAPMAATAAPVPARDEPCEFKCARYGPVSDPV
jgi:hypothetical protein